MRGLTLPRGLYAITDPALVSAKAQPQAVEDAIRGGAVMVQYRQKAADRASRLREAAALCAVCRDLGVPLIVNDDPGLAREVEAAGVHVGAHDASVTEARNVLGPGAIVGASCYNQLEMAVAAEEAGADYVAFGSFFPSPTKPRAVHASPDLLRAAKRRLTVPVAAIGGIDAENARGVVDAGADLLAVISALFGQDDVEAAARALADLYTR